MFVGKYHTSIKENKKERDKEAEEQGREARGWTDKKVSFRSCTEFRRDTDREKNHTENLGS